jgi:hypothetical protein
MSQTAKDTRVWLPTKPVWRQSIKDTHSNQSHHYIVPGYAVVGKVYPSENFPGQWFYTTSAGSKQVNGHSATEAEAKAEIEHFIETYYNCGPHPRTIQLTVTLPNVEAQAKLLKYIESEGGSYGYI